MRLLETKNLVIGYKKKRFTPPLSFEILKGQFWAVVGHNGSGKSTLLKTILKLIPSIEGSITFSPKVNLSYVAQKSDQDRLLPVRVIDAVVGGMESGWSFITPFGKKHSHQRALEFLQIVQLEHTAYENFWELSEGQKQRVLIARALAISPHLLFFDEPSSAMDMVSEKKFFEILQQMVITNHISVFMISHNIPLIEQFTTNMIMIDKDNHFTLVGESKEVFEHKEFISRFGKGFHSYTSEKKSE